LAKSRRKESQPLVDVLLPLDEHDLDPDSEPLAEKRKRQARRALRDCGLD
jgi:hypothetical protein